MENCGKLLINNTDYRRARQKLHPANGDDNKNKY